MEERPILNIVVADDQAATLSMLTGLLEKLPECNVAATASDGQQAVQAVELYRPEVLILDIAMPKMNGIEAARRIKSTYPKTKILFVTAKTDPAYVRAAFSAGASGYIRKASANEDLPAALRSIVVGEPFLSQGLSS